MTSRLPLGHVALVAASSLFCCSTLVWHGRSPDRRRQVRVVEVGGEQHVEVDGVSDRSFDGIGVTQLVFSRDSRRLVYPARVADAWMVVVDGQPGSAWDGVGEIRFSHDGVHLAYGVERVGRWHVVRDGEAGPGFAALVAGTLQFSSDGSSLAYVGADGTSMFVVVDDVVGPAFESIRELRFRGSMLGYVGRRAGGDVLVVGEEEVAADAAIEEWGATDAGQRAWVVRRDGRELAVIDGEEQRAYDGVSDLRLVAADSEARVAYRVRVDGHERVIVDGSAGPVFEAVRLGTLTLSGNGHHTYVARSDRQDRFVLDGAVGPPYDQVREVVKANSAPRWGYLARRGDVELAVIDGEPGPDFAWVGGLVMGPRGVRFAHFAKRMDAPGTRVVVDSMEMSFDLAIVGTLVFSKDGTHWACLTGDRGSRDLFVTLDGHTSVPVDFLELADLLLQRSADGLPAELLRDWVRAELELALARGTLR